MRAALLSTAFSVLALPLWAGSGDVSAFTLENGLQAVVIEDHRAPVAVQMVWYRAGSADEPRGKTGVAHFLEHLMFKGTDLLAPGELSKTVEANGGSDNAFTSYDYTAYFQRVAADRLELVMRMEADRMRGLTLSEEDWKTEHQVILEERAQRTDSDPAALLGEQMRAAQFLNHPYRFPVIGWKSEMEGLTRDDAWDWYQTNYAPDNAVLVVAGDVDPAEVRALAEQYYGPLAPNGALPPRIRLEEPPQLAARHLRMSDPRVAQPMLRRSYLAPQRRSGDQAEAAALTVLAEYLGGNPQSSALGRSLLFGPDAPALHVGAWYEGGTLDMGSLSVALIPRPGVTPESAEAALDEVLAGVAAQGIEAAQLERIKAGLRAAEIYHRDSTMALAREYGAALSTGLTVQDVQDWPEALAAVTAEDVQAAAQAVLTPAQSVTGWLLPEDGDA